MEIFITTAFHNPIYAAALKVTLYRLLYLMGFISAVMGLNNCVPTILMFFLSSSLSAASLLTLKGLVQLKLHCWVKNFPFVGFLAAILVARQDTCASHAEKGKIQAQKGLPTVHTCLPHDLSFCLFNLSFCPFVFFVFLPFCTFVFLHFSLFFFFSFFFLSFCIFPFFLFFFLSIKF